MSMCGCIYTCFGEWSHAPNIKSLRSEGSIQKIRSGPPELLSGLISTHFLVSMMVMMPVIVAMSTMMAMSGVSGVDEDDAADECDDDVL